MPSHYCTIAEVDSFQVKKSTWRTAVLAVGACAISAVAINAALPSSSLYVSGTTSRVQAAQPAVALAPAVAASAAKYADIQAAPVAQPYIVSQAPQHSVVGLTAIASGALMLLAAAVPYARQFFAPAETKAVAMASGTGENEKAQMRQLVANLDSADMRMLSRGGSMVDVVKSKGIDEVAQAIRADQLSRKDLTPKDVILEMQRGNGRFWMGLSERPDMDALSRRALIMAQAPKICVLSCSDSRVPVEIIFDQGLGEVFVVRMAGNILDANAHGSIEFAVKYLGVKVVLVIGHEGCGAVKGAMSMSPEDIGKEPFDLQVVLQSIRGGLDVKELASITDMRSREREAIVLNTSNQVKKLQQNQLIAEKCADGSLLVAGAFYEISSGIVDFFSLDKNGLVIDI